VLPLIGVAVGEYPFRGIAAIRTPLFMASAMVIGLELRATGGQRLDGWGAAVVVGGACVAAYAVLQQLLVGQILPSGAWYQLVRWDATTQAAYSGNLIFGRSSAFYVNPNILGVWAAFSMVVGLTALRGRVRYLIFGLSLIALILSASRGAIGALGIALIFLLVIAVRRKQVPSLRSLLPYAGVALLVAAGWALLSAAGAPASSLPGRIGSGVSVITGGSDTSVTGRLEFWKGALDMLLRHPFGTLGPPQTFLPTAVDSEWVLVTLQGSAYYLAATALALFGGAALVGDDSPERRALRALSVVIILAGITETPLQYPPAYIYWALVGWTLAGSFHRRSSG